MEAKEKLLMIGGLTPPLHGQAIAFEAAVQALRGHYQVKIVNTTLQRHGVYVVIDIIEYLARVWVALFIFKPKKVYFLSSRSWVGGMRDLYLLALGFFGDFEFYHHLHGSDFADYYSRSSCFRRWVIRKCYSSVKRHAVLIEGMDKELKNVAAQDKVTIVRNFFQHFNSIPRLRKASRLEICFLSSICPTKGVFDLISAFELVQQVYPSATLTIAGGALADGEQHADKTMHQLQTAIKANPGISYVGVLGAEQKYKLLSSSHVFCLPSRFASEAVPLSIIEAMASGCAVLVYDHKYLSGLVANGVNGFVVPKGDVEALASKIGVLAEDRQLMRKIGEHNAMQARERYSQARFSKDVRLFLEA